MEYITVKKASEKWSVFPRRVNYYCAYCAGGRIPGAVKMATIRLIPKDAEKPVDKRYKNVRKLVHERIVKMNGYTRGHVQAKCKLCGRETVFDVLSMRRLLLHLKLR